MHIGRILLGVIVYQVLVLILKILLKGFVWPDNFPEKFDLQRKIQKVVFQAEVPESIDSQLDIIVDDQLGLIAIPGGFEPAGKLSMWETDNGRLVEIIQQLTKEAVACERDSSEMTAIDQWVNNLSHVILSRFERQKAGWFERVPENLPAGN